MWCASIAHEASWLCCHFFWGWMGDVKQEQEEIGQWCMLRLHIQAKHTCVCVCMCDLVPHRIMMLCCCASWFHLVRCYAQRRFMPGTEILHELTTTTEADILVSDRFASNTRKKTGRTAWSSTREERLDRRIKEGGTAFATVLPRLIDARVRGARCDASWTTVSSVYLHESFRHPIPMVTTVWHRRRWISSSNFVI